MNGRSGFPSAKTGISQDSGFAGCGWCSCFGMKVIFSLAAPAPAAITVAQQTRNANAGPFSIAMTP
jgi:hypothetical protein